MCCWGWDVTIETLRSEIESLRRDIRNRTSIREQPTASYVPQIKLKEIVSAIPAYNGYNIFVLQFARSYRRALAMLPVPTPPDAEINLVRAIKARLQGHAYLAVEDEPVTSVEELIDALKAALSPHRSTNYYRGELNNLYKNRDEHVLDYITRTKDLRQAILDNEARDCHFSQNDRLRLEAEVLEHFIDGLPPNLLPLQMEDCKSLTDACHALLRIYHIAERDARRYGPTAPDWTGRGPRATYRNERPEAQEWRSTQLPPNVTTRTEPGRIEVTCNYCKKPGHMKFDCELRRINNERTQARITGNASGGLDGSSTAQAALDNRSTSGPVPNQPSIPSGAQ